MTESRRYEAKRYAHSLDYSYGLYEDYYNALVGILYRSPITRSEFMKLARQGQLNLKKPDAKSEHPHPIWWWNMDLPTHVLIAAAADDAESTYEDNYWAFTTTDERLAKQLAEAFEQEEMPKIRKLMGL